MENDASVDSQAQEATVTSASEDAQTPTPASGLNTDHQEVESIGPGGADPSDQAAGPNETNYGNHPKDETEHEDNQSFQDGEEGHQLSSESPGEESSAPEPNCSSDEPGGAGTLSGSSCAALLEEVSDHPGVAQEPAAGDPQDAPRSGHPRAGLEVQDTLRRRLPAPGEVTLWTSVLFCIALLLRHSTGQGLSLQRTSVSIRMRFLIS